MRNLLLALLAVLAAGSVHAEKLALVGGTLIDGNGAPPVFDSVILVDGERIEAVGQVGELSVPDDYRVISTEGMSVLPGLWDMHVHLMINGHADYEHWRDTYTDRLRDDIMPASALQLLMAGVTSARDLGAPLEDILAVREAIEAGEIPGPTMYVSGPFIQKEPYPGTDHYRWGVDGEEDARAKVRRIAEAGVDVVKLIDQDQMTEAEYMAVVDEAHKHGLPVVAHGHRPEEILRGLKAGVDNFEHTGLSTAPEYPPEVLAALRERTAQMNLGPMYWTPTVEGLFNYTYVREFDEHLDDPSWKRGLPDDIVADIEQSIQNPERLPYFQLTPQRKPTLKRKFDQLRESGLTLLVGTDSGIPMKFHSQSTWSELDVWVNHMGMDEMDTIRAATYWPARMMGVLEDVGTIEAGKYADIIAVRGDVLRYITLLRDVDIVIRRGKQYR
ncbi:MAG: amidohydrolase family protein [Xanthomonadales bacterium]|nr:amidohydrolase family protein [Xanthomonadales bacterium]